MCLLLTIFIACVHAAVRLLKRVLAKVDFLSFNCGPVTIIVLVILLSRCDTHVFYVYFMYVLNH